MLCDKSRYFNYNDGSLTLHKGSLVAEFPLQLLVNGREIATLISSPHDLRFLVAGFLRLQGFVNSMEDFQMFSVCEEFGAANVRIKGELPEKLKPVLTSGCGTGITFSLPSPVTEIQNKETTEKIQPATLFSLMDQLSSRTEQYRAHGGIHSAAIGTKSGEMLLYAEDIGRHNTLDRIAGEALFKGIDLHGGMLVTSGRISSEMAAKAAHLGLCLIASRTSPTDMATRLCNQAGICLVGYLRGTRFTIYSNPAMIEQYADNAKLEGITGVILAGGNSSRMGRNKALLELNGMTIIESIYRVLAALFHEVIIVTNSPADYAFLPCRTVPDLYPGIGSVAGLHSALAHSGTERVFITACDMPFVDPDIVRHLCTIPHLDLDALIPFSSGGQEPLHAVYDTTCKTYFESAIQGGERKILDILSRMNTRLVTWEELQGVKGAAASFLNINTPKEYEDIRGAH